jgi:hypothetical protein
MSAAPMPAWQVPPVTARFPDHCSITLGSNNRAVVETRDRRIRLIDLPSGDEIASTAIPEGTWPRWCGRYLAEVAADERIVRFRSTRTLELIGEVGFDDSIDGFAIDDTRIAVTDAATIVIADHEIIAG